ncbi:hypothetical protein [Streptomyces sp. NPDC005046]
MSNAGVARLVGVQAKTVGKWRRAFSRGAYGWA